MSFFVFFFLGGGGILVFLFSFLFCFVGVICFWGEFYSLFFCVFVVLCGEITGRELGVLFGLGKVATSVFMKSVGVCVFRGSW